jgi:DNA polymerase-3 subunit alpha
MLNDNDFIHLNVHSVYSILDSIAKIDELLKLTLDNGLKAMALTDYSSTCGISEFNVKARKVGIKPIFGFCANVYSVIPPERGGKKKRSTLILIAKDTKGYNNLIRLHNLAWRNFYYKPVLEYEEIEKYSKGLIAISTSQRGDLYNTFREGKDRVDEYIAKMDKIFGDDFYLEVQAVTDSNIEALNRTIFDYGHKYVVTSNIHYINKEDSKTHNILSLMSQKKTIADLAEGKAWINSHEDFYYKTPAEIKEYLKEEQWQHCLKSCNEIYNKVEDIDILDRPHLPIMSDDPERDIKDIIKKNFHKIPVDQKDIYFKRIKEELKVYRKTNSFNYLLIVKDFIDNARERGGLVNYGRGSACSSLITYLMGIHQIDPIKIGLYFMRFLNENRGVKMNVFD